MEKEATPVESVVAVDVEAEPLDAPLQLQLPLTVAPATGLPWLSTIVTEAAAEAWVLPLEPFWAAVTLTDPTLIVTGVLVGVLVGVAVLVAVGVLVGVFVGVAVLVGVLVGVA